MRRARYVGEVLLVVLLAAAVGLVGAMLYAVWLGGGRVVPWRETLIAVAIVVGYTSAVVLPARRGAMGRVATPGATGGPAA
jgi:hypothetical protein